MSTASIRPVNDSSDIIRRRCVARLKLWCPKHTSTSPSLLRLFCVYLCFVRPQAQCKISQAEHSASSRGGGILRVRGVFPRSDLSRLKVAGGMPCTSAMVHEPRIPPHAGEHMCTHAHTPNPTHPILPHSTPPRLISPQPIYPTTPATPSHLTPHHTIPYQRNTPHRSTPHHITPQHTTLHRTTPHYTTPNHTKPH